MCERDSVCVCACARAYVYMFVSEKKGKQLTLILQFSTTQNPDL